MAFTRKTDGVDDVMANDVNELQEAIEGGWLPVTETWTRTGNHTFTTPTDLTTRYGKGVKVRYKDGGALEYGVVALSAYSAPNTTVTLITNTDYAMAAATITEAAISRADTPEGFPDWFSYAPALTGFSADPAGGLYRWRTSGRSIALAIREPANGTSNAATLTITSPVVGATITNIIWRGSATVVDNGAFLATTGAVLMLSAGSSIAVSIDAKGAGGFTTSGGKRCAIGELTYEF